MRTLVVIGLALLALGGCKGGSQKPRAPSAQEEVEEQVSFQCDENGWCSEHPVPNGYDLHSVWGSPDGSLVIAVGEHGTIVERVDGEWRQLNAGTTLDILAIHGWPTGEAIAVGENGLVLHRESGSWRQRASGSPGNLRHVWGSAPNNVVAWGGLHWDGTRWQELLSSPRKWRLRATKAALDSYSDPPVKLEELEQRLEAGEYEISVSPVCREADGVSFLGQMWIVGAGGYRSASGSMLDWMWLVSVKGSQRTAMLTPSGMRLRERRSVTPLVCSAHGEATLVGYTGDVYRRHGEDLVMVEGPGDLAAPEILSTLDLNGYWCSNEEHADFVRKHPLVSPALALLCKAKLDFRDRAWIADKANDGVIVGDAGRVLEYRKGGWTQVFPKATKYSQLLKSFRYGAYSIVPDVESREKVWWKHGPGLWATEDGIAYVAYRRSVLRRSGPGQWTAAYELDDPNDILTAIWGTSSGDLFAGTYDGTISRFDGGQWTKEYYGQLVSITAMFGAGDHVWAAGADLTSPITVKTGACRPRCPPHTFQAEGEEKAVHKGILLRREGASWSKIRLPDGTPTLSSIWASSESDIYIGTLGRGLWHFDGFRWERREFRHPDPQKGDNALGAPYTDFRDMNFVYSVWGTPQGRLFVHAGSLGPTKVGNDLFILDDESTDVAGDGGSPIHGTGNRVLVSSGYSGVMELRDGRWTTSRLAGKVSRVWAGERYDYALSEEGHFWFRKRAASAD